MAMKLNSAQPERKEENKNQQRFIASIINLKKKRKREKLYEPKQSLSTDAVTGVTGKFE